MMSQWMWIDASGVDVLEHPTLATRARPDVGMTRVVGMPAVVVLPAPLGPSNPKTPPLRR
jgi:hypothetical protein